MSLKSAATRLCGNCLYASRRLRPGIIKKLKGKARFRQRYYNYPVYLRKYSNRVRDEEVFCRRENMKVNLFDGACAFWRFQDENPVREECQKSSEEIGFKACPYVSGIFKKSCPG